MPATATDINAATRDGAVATWSDSAIVARYVRARDGSLNPADGYCDALADGVTLIAARGALIGVERRRFVVRVQDVLSFDPAAALPSVTLIDAEQSANGTFLVTRLEVDLENETTVLELFG